MLDLKSLEDRLDRALNAETKESLEKWVLQQREKELLALLTSSSYFLAGADVLTWFALDEKVSSFKKDATRVTESFGTTASDFSLKAA